jgi:Glycosyl hydrolases family 39
VKTQRLVPAQVPIPSTYFGMHILHLSGSLPGYETAWPQVNVPAFRLWDVRVTWPDLEPTRGQWKFAVLDNILHQASEHETEVHLTFGFTPGWASSRPTEASLYQPGNAAEPKSMDDWINFVRTVATRYKGQIHTYEIWNEPNVHRYWSGSVEQMVEMAHQAHNIIKSIDPSAIIISPAPAGKLALPWFTSFLSAGGGRYADVIGYHFYVNPAPPEAMVPLIRTVQGILREHEAGEKPLWDTEAGWVQPPAISDELGAAYVARAFLLNWAAGVQRFYWYAWVTRSKGPFLPTIEADGKTLAPEGTAYGVIQKWLTGTVMNGCEQNVSHSWTCQLSDGRVNKWIVWNPDQTACLSIPDEWKIKHVTLLLSGTRPRKSGCIEVGTTPILLTR